MEYVDSEVVVAFKNLPRDRRADVAYVASYFEGFWGDLRWEDDRERLYRFIGMASRDEVFTAMFREHMERKWENAEEATERALEDEWARDYRDNSYKRNGLKTEMAFRDFHYDFPYPAEEDSQ